MSEISPVQIASNNVQPQEQKPANPQDLKSFDAYMVAQAPAEAKNPEPQPNAMQQGATSLGSYMQQLQEISNGQQY